jgi:hypothetical protein
MYLNIWSCSKLGSGKKHESNLQFMSNSWLISTSNLNSTSVCMILLLNQLNYTNTILKRKQLWSFIIEHGITGDWYCKSSYIHLHIVETLLGVIFHENGYWNYKEFNIWHRKMPLNIVPKTIKIVHSLQFWARNYAQLASYSLHHEAWSWIYLFTKDE